MTPTPAVGAVAPPSPSTPPGAALLTGSTLAPGGGVPLAAYPLLLGLMALLAGLAFARRRRRGAIVAPATSLGHGATAPDAGSTGGLSTHAPPGETDVPRWLRPSVVAARFETDSTVVLRAATVDLAAEPRAPSIFTDWTADAGERVQARYDGVPLLDTPDDALGRVQSELNAGDEALVLERGEIWTSVTTPAGLTGWVPSMVLMGVVESAEEDDAPSMTTDPATIDRDEDQPSLESLLQAAAAARRAREERLQAVQPAQPDPDGPATGRSRVKARKPSDAVKKPRTRASSRTRSSARGT